MAFILNRSLAVHGQDRLLLCNHKRQRCLIKQITPLIEVKGERFDVCPLGGSIPPL